MVLNLWLPSFSCLVDYQALIWYEQFLVCSGEVFQFLNLLNIFFLTNCGQFLKSVIAFSGNIKINYLNEAGMGIMTWLPYLKNNYIVYNNTASQNNFHLNYVKNYYILYTNLTINNVLMWKGVAKHRHHIWKHNLILETD